MKRAVAIALALLAAAGFIALGLWQVERRAWKLDLIARVEARAHGAPTAMPPASEWPRFDAEEQEYRRVRLTGMFLEGRDTLVQAVTARGGGFWVMTPLRTDAGTVLVNRGFVPPDKAAPRWCGPPQGRVTVTGLLRASEPGGGFLRSNDPAGNRWYSRDVPAIAAARGLGAVAPFFVDADGTPNAGGLPVGGMTVLRFNNNHLVYALTWFAMAGLSLGAAFLLYRQGRR